MEKVKEATWLAERQRICIHLDISRAVDRPFEMHEICVYCGAAKSIPLSFRYPSSGSLAPASADRTRILQAQSFYDTSCYARHQKLLECQVSFVIRLTRISVLALEIIIFSRDASEL